MEPFKNLYNKKSLTDMANELAKHQKGFLKSQFVKQATTNFSKKEMKERVIQIAEALDEFLQGTYEQQSQVLVKTLKNKQGVGLSGFLLWPYSYFIETRGIEHFNISMQALYEVTKRFTSEFGIRPFFERYPNETYEILEAWVQDKNEHVRRLVSEGTRPNLPWGMKVSHLPSNLEKNIRLLERLKDDPSEYVRKSVANHMNDITRVNRGLALKTLKKWQTRASDERKWIIKHALRSLLKSGDPRALELQGFSSNAKVQIKKLKLSSRKISEGDSIELSFELKNPGRKSVAYMVDYLVDYRKSNGEMSSKVFKLKSIELGPSEVMAIRKKISFKRVTTRRHYSGKHRVGVQVNGNQVGWAEFQLKV